MYVKDVKATLDFYTKAFGFEIKFCTPENDYGELSTGGTTLAFASETLGKQNLKKGFTSRDSASKPFGMELAFTTTHLASDFQRAVHAGATAYEPITEKPWGQQVGYLLDINGFLIELCTPMK
jgi:uncharacterized glyoxalase superfamily protein PhnB